MPEPSYAEFKERIIKLENKEKELNESESQFRTLFEHAGEAIFLIGPEGKFVDVNQRAFKNLGCSMHVSKNIYLC